MKKVLLVLFLFPLVGNAQVTTDTVGFMHYNLLNYRNITTYCTASNNSPSAKEGYMKTIVGHLLPDIITVNEMAGDGGTAARRLLDNSLNKDGRTYYKQCAYAGNSSLCNMLYYNQNKFVLHNQTKIERALNNSFLVRLIDVYTLYYNDVKKLSEGDTTYLTVYVAHLKAGTSSSDQTERKEMTDAIMKHHEENYSNHNYFIAGDFNIRSASEESYKALVQNTNSNIDFKDPINRSGSWNNSSTFASVHTQSTKNSSNGCASSGALDDRFDFILCGQEVISDTRGISYVPGSYTAVGNDGKHFNQSLISPANTSVPANVLSALYNMSDHLPVYMKISIGRSVNSINDLQFSNQLIINNPVNNILYWKMQVPTNGRFELRDIQGKLVYDEKIVVTQSWVQSDVSVLTKGTYYASFYGENGGVVRRKIVKM